MKYYLKDHVTDDMLIAVGFEIYSDDDYKYALKPDGFGYELYINLKKDDIAPFRRILMDNKHKNITVKNVKPFIQDLIELGYVEVRNE